MIMSWTGVESVMIGSASNLNYDCLTLMIGQLGSLVLCTDTGSGLVFKHKSRSLGLVHKLLVVSSGLPASSIHVNFVGFGLTVIP